VTQRDPGVADYAELHCISHFSFLRGASAPEELVARAAELGYRAIAMTDECSVAGLVRAHMEARRHDIRLLSGTEVGLREGPRLVVLAADCRGYASLCGLITRGRRAARKGSYELSYADLSDGLPGCRVLYLPDAGAGAAPLQRLKACFGNRLRLAAELFLDGKSEEKIEEYKKVADQTSCKIIAAGDVHMHRRGRRALQDTLTAIRLGCTVAEAGTALHANGERYLRSREALAGLYPADWLAESVRLAAELRFSLDDLRYQYPRELVPPGMTASAWLRHLTEQGIRWRWPDGSPRIHRPWPSPWRRSAARSGACRARASSRSTGRRTGPCGPSSTSTAWGPTTSRFTSSDVLASPRSRRSSRTRRASEA